MSVTQPETNLQRRIQAKLRETFPGCYVRKIHVSEFQTGGIHDLLCCIEGYFFSIEVKMPGEEMSQLQEYEASEVRKAKGCTFVATSSDEAIDGVRKHLRKRARNG